MTIQDLLGAASTFSPILPLIAGVRKKLDLVWIYMLTGLVFNLLIGRIFRGTDTSRFLANCYIILEFLLISLLYIKYFAGKRKMLFYGGYIMLLFAVYDIIRSGPYHFNGFAAAIVSVTYLAYCISSLYDIMLDNRIQNVFHSSLFLFTIGFLVYFSGMFMLYVSDSYFNTHELMWHFRKHDLMRGVWQINSLCNIAQSVIFTWAFLVMKKETTTLIPVSQ